jgi:integrase
MAKNSRRGHREGSVYFDKDKGRWVAAVSVAFGKRKKFYCESKQEAIRKRNEALRELERGTLATGPRRKLGEYLEDWIENVHKDQLRISTYVKYKKLVGYIVADLGDIWLQKLTPQDVQQFYAKRLHKDKLSTKTVHEIHGVLHLALKNAVRWNLVSRNVCDLVSAPRVVSRKAVPLTVEQAHALLECIRGHRLEVLLALAVVTGIRRGELLALRWSNIDFESQYVLIEHTVDYINGYGYVENEPKTAAGKRRIHLPDFLIDMLKQHRKQQLEQRLKLDKEWEDRDLVFTDLQGGYFNPRYMDKLFKKLLREAGIPSIHFHDLRHSAATILISMGVNPKIIQEILGHSDISITLGIYGHLFPNMQNEVAEKWDTEFGGADEDKDDGEESGGVPVKR